MKIKQTLAAYSKICGQTQPYIFIEVETIPFSFVLHQSLLCPYMSFSGFLISKQVTPALFSQFLKYKRYKRYVPSCYPSLLFCSFAMRSSVLASISWLLRLNFWAFFSRSFLLCLGIFTSASPLWLLRYCRSATVSPPPPFRHCLSSFSSWLLPLPLFLCLSSSVSKFAPSWKRENDGVTQNLNILLVRGFVPPLILSLVKISQRLDLTQSYLKTFPAFLLRVSMKKHMRDVLLSPYSQSAMRFQSISGSFVTHCTV